MQTTHRQMVLPFLADDPIYLREIREEKVTADLTAALEPVLRQRMLTVLDDMARAEFKEKLDALVADAVKSNVEQIRAMFSEIRFLLQEFLLRCADCRDPADWWKRGAEPDEDEDNPM